MRPPDGSADEPTRASAGEPLWADATAGADRTDGEPGRADDSPHEARPSDRARAAEGFAAPSAGSGRQRDRRAVGRDRGGFGSFLRELPVLLVVALVLAFLLRTFVVQVFYIPSSSMEPTLQIDDRMVVEKVTYRFRGPERGEIVVFEGPSLGFAPEVNGGLQRGLRQVGQFLGLVPASARDYVKRVIALGGDEVELVEGTVRVNGVELDEPYVVFDDFDDFGPVEVPVGTLFFLGDNRPNSSDSRRSLGFVSVDDVVGRAVVVLWPPDHVGRLTSVRHMVAAG